ncbi:MAG: hypothetical protein KDD37_03840 [Bdellovibrionales bacterium]|nr:hypothetical protein [Bdellovibrionales bacterium]
MRNQYLSVAFTISNAGNPSYVGRLYWRRAHNSGWPINVSPGYYMMNAADYMYLTISECPGDFRATYVTKTTQERAAGDPTFTKQCRVGGSDGQFSFSQDVTYTGACSLTPGKRYYMNIIFAYPYGAGTIEIDPMAGPAVESTCDQDSEWVTIDGKCEVQFFN